MEEQKKKKKIASKIVDVVLGALIVLILGLQIDMFITKNNNFGIPSLFGYSFMEVLTDSMEGENPDSFDAAYYEMELFAQNVLLCFFEAERKVLNSVRHDVEPEQLYCHERHRHIESDGETEEKRLGEVARN